MLPLPPTLGSTKMRRKSRISLRGRPEYIDPGLDRGLVIALAEIDGLREFLVLNNTQAATRFNYHLVLVSATFAGSAAVLGLDNADNRLRSGLVAALALVVLTLGILAFERIARSDIIRAEYLAMINLYRGYLLTREPDLRPYNILPAHFPGGPRPHWKAQSALNNLAISAALINSVAAAAASVMTVRAFGLDSSLVSTTVAILVLSVVSVGQVAWLRRLYRTGDQNLNRLLGISSQRH